MCIFYCGRAFLNFVAYEAVFWPISFLFNDIVNRTFVYLYKKYILEVLSNFHINPSYTPRFYEVNFEKSNIKEFY